MLDRQGLTDYFSAMRKDFGRVIHRLMAEKGIRSAKQLSDLINAEAGQKVTTSTAVTKWLSGKTQPKASSLMFLAKALKVSADIILFDDDENPDKAKELTKMVTKIVQNETQKLLRDARLEVKEELAKFLNSDKVPEEVKKSILRQVRDLLKIYDNEEKSSDSKL